MGPHGTVDLQIFGHEDLSLFLILKWEHTTIIIIIRHIVTMAWLMDGCTMYIKVWLYQPCLRVMVLPVYHTCAPTVYSQHQCRPVYTLPIAWCCAIAHIGIDMFEPYVMTHQWIYKHRVCHQVNIEKVYTQCAQWHCANYYTFLCCLNITQSHCHSHCQYTQI